MHNNFAFRQGVVVMAQPNFVRVVVFLNLVTNFLFFPDNNFVPMSDTVFRQTNVTQVHTTTLFNNTTEIAQTTPFSLLNFKPQTKVVTKVTSGPFFWAKDDPASQLFCWAKDAFQPFCWATDDPNSQPPNDPDAQPLCSEHGTGQALFDYFTFFAARCRNDSTWMTFLSAISNFFTADNTVVSFIMQKFKVIRNPLVCISSLLLAWSAWSGNNFIDKEHVYLLKIILGHGMSSCCSMLIRLCNYLAPVQKFQTTFLYKKIWCKVQVASAYVFHYFAISNFQKVKISKNVYPWESFVFFFYPLVVVNCLVILVWIYTSYFAVEAFFVSKAAKYRQKVDELQVVVDLLTKTVREQQKVSQNVNVYQTVGAINTIGAQDFAITSVGAQNSTINTTGIPVGIDPSAPHIEH